MVDKYAVCVMLGDEIVGHLKKGRTGRFAKTVFYFLRADEKGSCTAIVKGKAVNLGDGEGMQARGGGGGGTLGISRRGCAAGTLEPLAYTRASSAIGDILALTLGILTGFTIG